MLFQSAWASDKMINVKDEDAEGDGVTNDTAAFREILEDVGKNSAVIEIPAGTFLVDKISFPENVTLKFNGGRILVPKDGSVEINGVIDAGICEIFTGEGDVKGNVKNLYVYPQWFGAKGDEKSDDATAIQKAAALAKTSSGRTLFIPGGRYLIEKNIGLACNVECRGVIVKKVKVDEAKTVNSFSVFVPSHRLENNPLIVFNPDDPDIKLAPSAFFGIKRNDFKIKNFENIPVVGNPDKKINLEEGGTLSFYSTDFFTSRRNNYGDERYDKCDQCQIVSPRGDVFPEFCFSYDAFPDAPEWSPETVYKKGDYCKVKGNIYKATFVSGPGTFFENKFKGKIDIGPFSPANGCRYKFKYQDGIEDSIQPWLVVSLTVTYQPYQLPLTVNNLAIEIYLKDSDGKAKRIGDSGTLAINRSNMTFNNMSISCKSRNAGLSSLCSIYRCSRIVFNNCNFSGATYHGLGYNVVNSNVSNISFNNCISVNCRDAIAGRHGKNMTINGGYYFSIDDHYGKNYTVRDAEIQGISTYIPGYCTPKADLEKWDFCPRTAFAFGGGDIHIENCRIYNTYDIIALRGGEADMADSRITMRDIVIKGSSDVKVIDHSIDKDFDYAHKLQVPRIITLENIKINSPYKLSFFSDVPGDLRYEDVCVANCGPWDEFRINSEKVMLSGCTFKDTKFIAGPGTLFNFSNCIFSGKVSGLSDKNIGISTGNCKTKNSELSFPINYINKDVYME